MDGKFAMQIEIIFFIKGEGYYAALLLLSMKSASLYRLLIKSI